jgi:hypothetical protein
VQPCESRRALKATLSAGANGKRIVSRRRAELCYVAVLQVHKLAITTRIMRMMSRTSCCCCINSCLAHTFAARSFRVSASSLFSVAT